ncbi:sensor domain-containing diguanylate cyclase [Desulfosediminicola flagellatus]|uniref:sensor domain-containing diguanylate cyclase n=1 Tax=Desulfosediminicola flagellatus TaxID=2569541 RepID=UPI0010ACDF34|nr:diguanylate cyclase [Desulfosediminicola flagellatus]
MKLMILFHCVTALLALLTPWNLYAVDDGDCVSLNRGTSTYNLEGLVSYYEDKSTNRTIDEILNDTSVSWNRLAEVVPSFGFSNSAYWLKIDVCQPWKEGERTVLEVSYPLLDSIDVFGVVENTIVYRVHTGDGIPYSQRPEQHRNFIFSLPIFQSEATIYLRIQTESAVQVPMAFFTATQFFEHNQKIIFIQGCYFGIILAMIFYNVFLFFSLREWPYLLYVVFTCFYFSFQGVLQGFFQQFLLDSVWWQQHALLIFGYFTMVFANLFAVSFLNLTRKIPVIAKLLHGIAFLAVLAAMLAPVMSYGPMVKLMLAIAIPSASLIMISGVQLWWSGHLPARIFTLAWFTLLFSFVLASLSKFGILPRAFWTDNSMQIGGVLEVLLLSIALGERINEEKRQRILVEQNLSSSLEQMVEERTSELNHALEQLEEANIILDKMSLTDSLTQIPNRRAFDKHIEREYSSAKREGAPIGLVMIDIDYFKNFNDTYGHQVGDEVLQNVAKTLRALATRPSDEAFRYGGEEFAVLLSNTNLEGVIIVAEKMRKAIEKLPLNIDGETCVITISAGISVYDQSVPGIDIYDLELFISEADAQLYRAKEMGRNCVSSPQCG